jgi:hypothetical protein
MKWIKVEERVETMAVWLMRLSKPVDAGGLHP